MRVMILVTHLLGTGHLSRAVTLGDAFRQANHDVDIVSGGTPVPNLRTEAIRLHQLPPVKSDGIHFNRLLDSLDQPVDGQFMADRCNCLVSLIGDLRPDVLITELYPFGRRVLKSEFLAALEAAVALPNRPIILASIRDILAPPSTAQKEEDTANLIAEFYDAVLVHSDPAATPLEVSWPVTNALSKKLRYTGYVAPPAPLSHPDKAGQHEVLVTAGGGGVGTQLFETAVKAAKKDRNRHWHLLVGGSDKDASIQKLRQQAGNLSITIEPVRRDFRQMLNHAAVSVSMCGYNTAIDLLQTRTPGVFVPFDLGGEVEQTLRAESLAKRQGYALIPSNTLTPESLLQAVDETIAEGAAETHAQFDGAAETVRIVEQLFEAGL
ncbi:MAG: glycosyltransferase [Rhodobacteraceae bacterium]|nr:glycosyltransferase [Paracoccaceae bacterium]